MIVPPLPSPPSPAPPNHPSTRHPTANCYTASCPTANYCEVPVAKVPFGPVPVARSRLPKSRSGQSQSQGPGCQSPVRARPSRKDPVAEVPFGPVPVARSRLPKSHSGQSRCQSAICGALTLLVTGSFFYRICTKTTNLKISKCPESQYVAHSGCQKTHYTQLKRILKTGDLVPQDPVSDRPTLTRRIIREGTHLPQTIAFATATTATIGTRVPRSRIQVPRRLRHFVPANG